MKENLLHVGYKKKKNSSVVSYKASNSTVLYPAMAKNKKLNPSMMYWRLFLNQI
jgi:hypothetical protein